VRQRITGRDALEVRRDRDAQGDRQREQVESTRRGASALLRRSARRAHAWMTRHLLRQSTLCDRLTIAASVAGGNYLLSLLMRACARGPMDRARTSMLIAVRGALTALRRTAAGAVSRDEARRTRERDCYEDRGDAAQGNSAHEADHASPLD
jgi:hypothetical protein